MSKDYITKNDTAWEELFDKYSIIDSIEKEGVYKINASDINEFREARLMTKFDHEINLPKLFKSNKLSILPITRGSYIIAPFKAYHKFEASNDEVEYISFPNGIESIDFNNITSEATALSAAYVSGILTNFLQEEIIPTISGRMSSLNFDFTIKNRFTDHDVHLQVKNSQLEIDGSYEGHNSMAILEAKHSLSSDFLVRQLYYPFRLWERKISKLVRPVFFTYSNGIYHLYEYRFDILNNYNSLQLIRQKNYCIAPEDISLEDIYDIYSNIQFTNESTIPFPQANSFDRVINLLEHLYENKEEGISSENITLRYDFDKRQTDYYTNAGRYLGVIEKRNINGVITFFLTKKGLGLFKTNVKRRNLKLIELILEHKSFYLVLEDYFNNQRTPSKDTIVYYMKTSDLYNINSEDTYYRRASTVIKWINWILDLPRI